MTLYAELLKLALADDVANSPGDGLGTLALRLASRRAAVAAADREEFGAAEWTAAMLAHDALLVRLSNHLAIEERLTTSGVPTGERERLLNAVQERGIALERYELLEPRKSLQARHQQG